MTERLVSRRDFLKASALVAGAVALGGLAACDQAETPSPSGPTASTSAASGATSVSGVPYPPDAASPEKQYTVISAVQAGTAWRTMDSMDAGYSMAPLGDMFSEPLTRLNRDYEVEGGAATRWEVDPSGKVWTFHIADQLIWSNGDPLTAEDFVATFRYAADPAHAWDFAWYFSGIVRNFTEINKGQLPTDNLGVRVGKDKSEFVVETDQSVPYLPGLMGAAWAMHAKSLDKFGSGVYNTDPATCISCGPYLLEEWSPDRRIAISANVKYRGNLKPLINRYVANIVSGGSDLDRYLAGEIDRFDNPGPGDLRRILSDPALKSQLHISAGDFRCFYLFWDVTKSPFNDKKVRLAFAKAIDRVAIIDGILAPLAIPAYGFLAPGFPDSDQEALKDIQAYDPEAARQLLAEAGYPNGAGFPSVTLTVRGGGPASDRSVTQAVVASINNTLNVNVGLQTKDAPTFMSDLTAQPTKVDFGWVSYGFDYFDASNMLGVWLSGGRHNWNNATFDDLVKRASTMTDDLQQRSKMMKEAEKLLASEAPGAFVYFVVQGQMHKPYRKGYLTPNRFGYDGSLGGPFPYERTNSTELKYLYLTKEVEILRR